jgi:hypothetical protein
VLVRFPPSRLRLKAAFWIVPEFVNGPAPCKASVPETSVMVPAFASALVWSVTPSAVSEFVAPIPGRRSGCFPAAPYPPPRPGECIAPESPPQELSRRLGMKHRAGAVEAEAFAGPVVDLADLESAPTRCHCVPELRLQAKVPRPYNPFGIARESQDDAGDSRSSRRGSAGRKPQRVLGTPLPMMRG